MNTPELSELIDPTYVRPRLLLDAQGHILLVLVSDQTIGVSLKRFPHVPDPREFPDALVNEDWVTIFRDETHQLFMSTRDEEGSLLLPVKTFRGAAANESAQFTIEVALATWPEWGNQLRDQYEPKVVIPLPRVMPEA